MGSLNRRRAEAWTSKQGRAGSKIREVFGGVGSRGRDLVKHLGP